MAEPTSTELLIRVLVLGGIVTLLYHRFSSSDNDQDQTVSQKSFEQRKTAKMIYLAGLFSGAILIFVGMPETQGLIVLGGIFVVFFGYKFQTQPL